MNINKIALLLFSASLIVSCEIEDATFEESKTAVVEAYLFAGQSVDSICISQTYSYNQEDSTIMLLDGLDVVLSDFENEYPLVSIGDGIYQNLDHIVEADKSYRLEFTWENELIAAETYIPIKRDAELSSSLVQLEKIESGTMGSPPTGEMADPIQISWDNSEGDYYYVVINNIESSPEYVNENVGDFDDENGGRVRFTFTSEPSVMDTYNIDPRQELTQFGTYEVIVFRVNPEYAALYESSGNTTQSLEEPPSNIENGLGIFTGVNSDTLYLEVEEI